jgi:hypothetical protein
MAQSARTKSDREQESQVQQRLCLFLEITVCFYAK